MAHPTSVKRCAAACVAAAVLGIGVLEAAAQDLTRVNQDELASFYGRMNVVVGSGARAFGMGGAFLARADDATAASWNPAGLSYLRRLEFSLVGAHNDFAQKIPRVSASFPVTTTDQLRGSVADFAGVAYPLRIKERSGAIQFSYQRSFSFSGSRRSAGTIDDAGFTVEGKGGFDTLSLSSGFEVHPKVRLGLSLNRLVNGFSQTVSRPRRQVGSDWRISGTNVHFGVLLTPTPALNLGAVLKTPFRAHVLLTKDRQDSETSNRGSGEVRIRFPRVYGVGTSYRATNTVTLSADFTRTAWSQADITGFFSLAQKNDGDPSIDYYPTLPFPGVEFGANGQRDTNQVRIGVEWVLRIGQSGNVLIPLRSGLFRDGQPVTGLLNGPGALASARPTFSGFTMGVGVTVGGALFDLAYIRESGTVPASRQGNGIADDQTRVRYNRLFASVMLRLGQRR